MEVSKKSHEPFDIYVRPSQDRNILFFHGGLGTRAEVEAIRVEGKPLGYLELSVRPEWITDERYLEAYQKWGRSLHLRLPIHGGDLRTLPSNKVRAQMESDEAPSEPFAIYVRHSGEFNFLHFYGGYGTSAEADAARQEGKILAFIELSVLPEWITDESYRAAYHRWGRMLHLKIPIHSGDLRARSGC